MYGNDIVITISCNSNRHHANTRLFQLSLFQEHLMDNITKSPNFWSDDDDLVLKSIRKRIALVGSYRFFF